MADVEGVVTRDVVDGLGGLLELGRGGAVLLRENMLMGVAHLLWVASTTFNDRNRTTVHFLPEPCCGLGHRRSPDRQSACFVATSSSSWRRSPLALSALVACTSDDSGDPGGGTGGGSDTGTAVEAAAGALADALASGDFTAVGFTTTDPQAVGEEYAATVEGLEDLEPTVTVADVSEPSGEQPTATATFDWTWPIGPDGWTYSSQAALEESEDEWLAEWDVAAIEPSLSTTVTLDLVSWGPSVATSSAPAGWPW